MEQMGVTLTRWNLVVINNIALHLSSKNQLPEQKMKITWLNCSPCHSGRNRFEWMAKGESIAKSLLRELMQLQAALTEIVCPKQAEISHHFLWSD